MASIAELLDGHVTLEVECLERLYLNGYIGALATSGGSVTFLREQPARFKTRRTNGENTRTWLLRLSSPLVAGSVWRAKAHPTKTRDPVV
jgi:hypothetical protein